MFDLKTLKTIDEALDMALDNLVEENAFKKDSPYAQSFVRAKEKVQTEITRHQKQSKFLISNASLRRRR